MLPPACANHPGNEARLECVPCRRYLCFLCVRPATARASHVHACLRCGGLATAIGTGPASGVLAQESERARAHRPLPERLATQAPRILTRRSVLVVLLGLSLLDVVVRWASELSRGLFGAIAFIFVLGLEASFYFQVVDQTACGKDDLEAPEIGHLVDFILAPMLRYLAAGLPIIVGVLWFAGSARSFAGGLVQALAAPLDVLGQAGPAVLIIVGLALWPLLTVIAATTGSLVSTMTPRLWGSTLRTLGWDYVIGAAAFYFVLAFEVLLFAPVRARVASELGVPFVSAALYAFLGYLPWTLRARILGVMCEPHMDL